VRAVVLFMCLGLALAGCGLKGDPDEPEPRRPIFTR
jgi:predicted small lipoprotein YifL